MQRVKLFEQYLNENLIFDKINNQPLFKEGEVMTASKFLSIIKKSPEAKEAIKSNRNFGEGIQAVKYLKSALPVRIEVSVYRSAWNYGGNLVLTIGVAGMGTETYSDAPFKYRSGANTTTPSYSVGHYFEGLPHPAADGYKPVEANVTYGNSKSISNHQGMIEDIVGIFKAYEQKHGEPFDPRKAKQLAKQRAAIKKQFSTLEDRISKDYYAMRDVARKLGISTLMPNLVLKHKEIRMKIDEPRQYRHPDEYATDATMSKDFAKYEKLQGKIVDKLQKFADKHNLEVSVAAGWSY